MTLTEYYVLTLIDLSYLYLFYFYLDTRQRPSVGREVWPWDTCEKKRNIRSRKVNSKKFFRSDSLRSETGKH